MVQRRAAATAAAAVAAASRPLQPRALFANNSTAAPAGVHAVDAQTPASGQSLPSTHSMHSSAAPGGSSPNLLRGKVSGTSGASLASLWAEHQQSCAPTDSSAAPHTAGKLIRSHEEAMGTPGLGSISHELIGCRVADADACHRVNGLLVSWQPQTLDLKP